MSKRGNGSGRMSASGFFVLRTPLLPFTELEGWSRELEAAAHVDSPDLEAVLTRDRDRLRRRLRKLVAQPEFRDAVFVASPTLEAAIEQWERDAESERGRTTEEALVAYFSRAAARPTPFGLFAGSTTGTIGGQTALRLTGLATYRRHSRLDMEYLSLLADAVERNPSRRRHLLYRPNSSLYEIAGRYHYAERRQTPNGRSYDLVAVDRTPYLADTLARAESGATIETLAAALVDDEVTQADAEDYVGELVDSQVLTAEVGPRLTGAQPTDALVEALAVQEETVSLAAALRDAAARLDAIDDDGVGAAPDRYRSVAAALADLPVRQRDLSRLVQVDLMKPVPGATLAAKVSDEAARGARILHAFFPAGRGDPLARFREEFTGRYETREVPLVEALDEEHGIGFDRSNVVDDRPPLLRGIPLARGGDDATRWAFRDRLLLRKLTDALAGGATEIELDEADVQAAESVERPPLPHAFEVVAAVEADSAEAVDRGDFRLYVHSASGPPGARLLGRFCHADERLHELVRENLRAEETAAGEPMFAEIVHLPEGRVGNILSRPVFRDYEIPYLGLSGAPSERQVPVSDLLVSVENGAVVLRSRRLGREIVPRLTTAHNYSRRSLRVYRFLCALQGQGVLPGVMWHWGPLEASRFLPRVVSGRTVLSRARWNLDHDELGAFREPRGSRRFAAVQRLRALRSLPRWVALADGDNDFVVDLENVLAVDALARQLRKRPTAALVEVFPAWGRLCVTGPEGSFVNHLVIPFVRGPDEEQGAVAARTPSRLRRRFPPASEWLYARLYAGPATSDVVLDRAARALHASLASGSADRWFFIRYSDPDWHLRVRAHGVPERLAAETLPTLHAALSQLLESERVWRVQLDTYEREVERYGGDRGIELAEDVFHADSDAVVEIVRALDGAESDLRWRAALLGIDLLLEDFSLTLEEKRDLARRACSGYGREFAAGKAFQKEISRRYRQEREAVETLVDMQGDPPPALAPVVAAFGRRSQRVRPVAAELRALADGGELTQAVPGLVMSFAHMHVNRLLRSAQRAQELVLYEFLARAYSSQAARR